MVIHRRGQIAGAGLLIIFLATVKPLAGQLNCTEGCQPTLALVPLTADANFMIEGNEIKVTRGTSITLEIRVANWDSDGDGIPALSAFQVTVDSASYSNGSQGAITPFTMACVLSPIKCFFRLQMYVACGNDGFCLAGFSDFNRFDYLLGNGLLDEANAANVDLSTTDYRYWGSTPDAPRQDPGDVAYIGTLILEVPQDAAGTFTIKLSRSPSETFLLDEVGNPIESLLFEDAKITVVPDDHLFMRKNRFLTMHPGRHDKASGIRVRFTDLEGEFAAFNGQTMWVDEPKRVSAQHGKRFSDPVEPGEKTMLIATLTCDPVNLKWGLFPDPIHVYHELIVPNSTYEVQTYLETFVPDQEDYFSNPFALTTSRHGEVVGFFDVDTQLWTAPSSNPFDLTDITDVVAILEGFSGRAPDKTRWDLVGLGSGLIDGKINFTDVVQGLNAFRSEGYSFEPPLTNPCP